MATYAWKDGARLKADPQAVGERLERLHERHGGAVTPAAVVRDARRPSSPLHPCFTWDDAEAAERHREGQAREVLRSIVVVIPEREDQPPVRAFVVVREGEADHYTTLFRAMSDGELRRQVLQRAFRELEALRAKYAEYEELAAVFEAADRARGAAA